jgi:alkylhydroperoxidase family enzyme
MSESQLALGRAPEPTAIDDEVAAQLPTTLFYRDGTPLRMFSALAYHAPAFHAVRQFSHALGTDTTLSLRERELVILRVASLVGNRYEWDMHRAVCVKAQLLSERELEALRADALPGDAYDDPRERALLVVADQITRDAALSEEGWETVTAQLGVPSVVEAILWAGWYRLLAGVAGSFDFASDSPPD